MKLYKLTDSKHQTRNSTQWGENVTHEATGDGKLCGPGWLHAYTDPLLAVLLNPIHGNIGNPVLWEAEGDIGKDDRGLKVGCKSLTTIKQLDSPEITVVNRIAFGIFCALEVYHETKFKKWANGWLNNTDRSAYAAAVAYAAANAAYAAVANATNAYAAANAAYAAVADATNAYAANAAYAAANAAEIDLPAIAKKAMTYK
jgi:hypothetical protein